jgi:hypothetical protein
MKVAANKNSQEFGPWERILRSRVARGIVRIHIGYALFRSWAMDTQIPHATSIHLFDYLLYRRTDMEEPFEAWVKKRRLLSP